MPNYQTGAVYQWKSGHVWATDAQETGDYLEELSSENDHKLTPETLVEDAKPKESFLHPNFEWNDAKAAEIYRKETARAMMRSLVMVRYQDSPEDMEPVRAYVHVGKRTDRGYTSIIRAMSDEKLAEEVIAQAKKDLQAFRRKYQSYEYLHEAVGNISRVMGSIEVYTN